MKTAFARLHDFAALVGLAALVAVELVRPSRPEFRIPAR